MDADRSLLPGSSDDAHDQASAEVCARLGVPEEWVAEDGYEHAITAGTIDGERIAWVERRSRCDGGREDVDYYLRSRVGDAPRREWVVDTYNPYFGCRVGYLRWWGEQVVIVYREKHATVVCALEPGATPRMRALSDRWRVVGDVVLYASEARGLVEQVHLPDLEPRAPLPRAVAAEWVSSRTCGHSPRPEVAPEELQRRIAARLPALRRATAELLIGALAYRFWDAWPPPADRYDALVRMRYNPPCWLPFYCHAAASAAEARALLAELDAVAARPAATCQPGDAAVELACRHLADRCRELAAACRAGRLPEGTSCYFWAEWSQASFAKWESLFPAAMRAAWRELRPRARELAALGGRG